MRKLERGDLIPALKDRDAGTLLDYEYTKLAMTLKEELDVTLLRAQDAHKIRLLMNMDTRERMLKQQPVQTGDDQSSVQRVVPNQTDILSDIIVDTEVGTVTDDVGALPEAPVSDEKSEPVTDVLVTPAPQGQGRVSEPTEAPSTMAA